MAHPVTVGRAIARMGPLRRRAARCTSSSSAAAPARPARRPTICSGERDAAGQTRAAAEILRCDPGQVAAAAYSLEFEHKYRSAAIVGAREDRPADAQIEAVLDEFEQTAWAGPCPLYGFPGPPGIDAIAVRNRDLPTRAEQVRGSWPKERIA